MKTKNIIFLKGEKIDLCVPQKELHMNLYLKWLNDEEVVKYLLRGVFPLTLSQEEKWFEEINKANDRVVFTIATKQGETIGNVGLHHIDHISRIAEAGIFIGEKKEWNKGYGSEAERLLINYGFVHLNLRKIFARIFTDNKASINAALKAGFKKEALLKKHFWNKGKFCDLAVLSIFNR